MRILFMGTPDFAAESLKALYDAGMDVCGVFTQPDKPVGRKQTLQAPPVKTLALEHGTPVYQPEKLRDGTAMEIIRTLAPDVIAVVAYGRILPKDMLDYPKYGAVNIHGSLLPKYRGSAPIQYAVLNGDAVTGVTAMYMAEAMDAGDIIEKRETEILPGETAGELFDRLAPLGGELLVDTMRALERGTVTRTPQDESGVTLAPPLTKEMADIDWNESAKKVAGKILGLDPWPAASAELGGVRLKLFKAFITDDKGTPGTLVSADKNGMVIACGEGAVRIRDVQAPGGKRMSAADYLRGHKI